jgi:hypothetical protein
MSEFEPAAQPGNDLHPNRQGSFLKKFYNRWDIGVLAACYALSRFLFWILGVRFQSTGVEHYWQFLDIDLLKHQLWVSILFLHAQPPLMNLYYGMILKVFSVHWLAAAYSVQLLLGLLAYLAIYSIMTTSKIARQIALAVVIIAMCNPSAVVYEAEPLYTHVVFCFLVFAAYFFLGYLKRPGIAGGAAFLGILTLLVLWRSSYQIVWYLFCAFWLIVLTPAQMIRRIVVLALIFGGIIGSVYLKNGILLGSFNTSSWAGMSLAKGWATEKPSPEVARLIQEKILSPISAIPPDQSMNRYLPIIGPLPKTGVPAADEVFRRNGSLNINNIGYVRVSKLYAKDFWRLLKVSPKTILQKVIKGWLDYFRPSSAYLSCLDSRNQSAVESVDRWYRLLFCAGAQNALEFFLATNPQISQVGNLFRRLRAVCWQIVAVYVLFALYLVYSPFRRLVAAGDASRRQLVLFLIFNISYCAVLTNSVEIMENMRYRYETQGLALVAATIIFNSVLEAVSQRFRAGLEARACPAAS